MQDEELSPAVSNYIKMIEGMDLGGKLEEVMVFYRQDDGQPVGAILEMTGRPALKIDAQGQLCGTFLKRWHMFYIKKYVW